MNRNLTVRSEGQPARCEICHQSDCLDLETLECSRCNGLVLLAEPLYTREAKEEQFSGLVIPFRRTRAARATAGLLAAAVGASIVGPVGALFFTGLMFFLIGARRVLADAQFTGNPAVDLILNLTLMSAGLAGCCWSGLYFLRLIETLN